MSDRESKEREDWEEFLEDVARPQEILNGVILCAGVVLVLILLAKVFLELSR